MAVYLSKMAATLIGTTLVYDEGLYSEYLAEVNIYTQIHTGSVCSDET